MSRERLDIWDDPNVTAALKDGRAPADIAILSCKRCGLLSYYNQGSSFTCRHCHHGFRVATQDEILSWDRHVPRDWMVLDDGLDSLTLADVIDAQCEDY